MPSRPQVRTLYLCYFGLREPLVQTQVLPYLREIRKAGIEVSLLTFEPHRQRGWSAEAIEQWRARLQCEGIRWLCLRYHKRPSLPATLYDILTGVWFVARLVRRDGIHVLHARSHVAAAIGTGVKKISGGRLIFDIRGFMPEEYVDAGRWPAGGHLYRLTKVAERWVMAAADGFVVLTEQARDILFPGCTDADPSGRPIEVIPCCVDLERFMPADGSAREAVRRELGLVNRRVLVYVGALGGWYLTDELTRFVAAAHQQDPSTFSMILTQSAPEGITMQLSDLGVSSADCLVRKVPPHDVPHYLAAADLAVSFIKPCYSKLASSPTKLAEYLASGLPVICNAGIGDVDQILQRDRVGIIVREFTHDAYLRALQASDALRQEKDLPGRCRASAREHFDLRGVGGQRYRRLYSRLPEHVNGSRSTTAAGA